VSDTLSDELELLDRYWSAANYLSVGQIYLLDNPLLREPVLLEHVKPRRGLRDARALPRRRRSAREDVVIARAARATLAASEQARVRRT
jgi:hypothetical protein